VIASPNCPEKSSIQQAFCFDEDRTEAMLHARSEVLFGIHRANKRAKAIFRAA
jgi:hypothetical protein